MKTTPWNPRESWNYFSSLHFYPGLSVKRDDFLFIAGPAAIPVAQQSCPRWKSTRYRRNIRATTRVSRDPRQLRRPSPFIYSTVSGLTSNRNPVKLIELLPTESCAIQVDSIVVVFGLRWPANVETHQIWSQSRQERF